VFPFAIIADDVPVTVLDVVRLDWRFVALLK
jgi:hypothetical protein